MHHMDLHHTIIWPVSLVTMALTGCDKQQEPGTLGNQHLIVPLLIETCHICSAALPPCQIVTEVSHLKPPLLTSDQYSTPSLQCWTVLCSVKNSSGYFAALLLSDTFIYEHVFIWLFCRQIKAKNMLHDSTELHTEHKQVSYCLVLKRLTGCCQPAWPWWWIVKIMIHVLHPSK